MKTIGLFLAFIFCLSTPSSKVFGQTAAAINEIGNLDVTTTAEALAKVYADDINKEVDIYFFDRFSILLNSYPELRTLFPCTTVYLDNVANYQYTAMLSTLRAAFYKDLKTLPMDITEIANLDTASCCVNMNAKHTEDCKKRIAHFQYLFNNDKGRTRIAALLIVDGALNKTNAAVMLNNIATNHAIAADKGDIYNVVKLLNIFSTSLISDDNSRIWIDPTALAQKTNPANIAEYIDSLKERIKAADIQIRGVKIYKILDTMVNTAGLIKYLDTLVIRGYGLDTSITKLKKDTLAADRINNMALFIEDFRRFFMAAVNFDSISNKIPMVKIPTKQIFYAINSSFEISKDIMIKDYQSAVFTSVLFIDSLMETKSNMTSKGKVHISHKTVEKRKDEAVKVAKYDDKKQFVQAAFVNSKSGAVQANLLTLSLNRGYKADSLIVDSLYRQTIDGDSIKYEEKENTFSKIQFKENVLKYGTLIANIVTADSAEQITAAIEAAALPPGSSIIKKTYRFSIALQGYAGLPLGYTGAKLGDNVFRSFNSIAPYAPLGVSFNFGLKSWRNEANKSTAGAFSVYLSVIDIGAIVAYDLKNNTTASHDSVTIRLENIFAPGVNLIYGVPGVPLAVGAGFQYQPSLQRFNNSGTTIKENSGVRWQLFAVFDLPFYNLYVSKR